MRRSTQLLRTEVIDLMQIHNMVDWQTHLTTLRRMKDEGRIRYIGISHFKPEALPEMARILIGEPGIDFVQLGYSLATRAAENEMLPLAASRGVAVIANRVLEVGGLFRRMRGARCRSGQANSTVRAGRSFSSNTSSPSPPSHA